jgi:predicted nucleic acid-binding protein
MKLVLHSSVAMKWYLSEPDKVKALRLRLEFHRGIHQLLAPDVFPVDCGAALLQAQRKRNLISGDTIHDLVDLGNVGVAQYAVWPLIQRAAAIALLTRLTIADSLYIALAEREGCTMIAAEQKLLRKTRQHFPFVVDFALLP